MTLKLLGPPAGESPVGILIDTRNGALTDELELGALSMTGRAAVVRIQLEDDGSAALHLHSRRGAVGAAPRLRVPPATRVIC